MALIKSPHQAETFAEKFAEKTSKLTIKLVNNSGKTDLGRQG